VRVFFGLGDPQLLEPCRRFLFSALFYLTLGGLLGLVLLINPLVSFLPEGMIHSIEIGSFYLVVVGFLCFMVFGVSYRNIPKYIDAPLYSVKLAYLQYWMANVGLAGLVVFSIFADMWGSLLFEADADARAISAAIKPFQKLAIVFGALETAALFLFVYIIIKTVNAKVKHHH